MQSPSQKIQKESTCPQCQADLSPYLQLNHSIEFCPQCLLPLFLIANKYKLLRVIDEGEFSTIYHAHHTSLSRDPERVVKVIKAEAVRQPEMRQRFEREVQLTALLSQENNHIVRIYDDFGSIPRLGTFYVMEFLKGPSLLKYLEDPNQLPTLPWCIDVFEQLCDAMMAAHGLGVVHRDLKPDNLLLVQKRKKDNFLKVLDFGIAKPLDGDSVDRRLTQGILGSPFYLAPEQALDKPIDERTDIYAMGVILYELLTGQIPGIPLEKMSSTSALELITLKLQTKNPPAPHQIRPDRGIPKPLSQAICKAIAFNPEDRFANAEELWEELQQYTYLVKTPPPSIVAKGDQPRDFLFLPPETHNNTNVNEHPSSYQNLPAVSQENETTPHIDTIPNSDSPHEQINWLYPPSKPPKPTPNLLQTEQKRANREKRSRWVKYALIATLFFFGLLIAVATIPSLLPLLKSQANRKPDAPTSRPITKAPDNSQVPGTKTSPKDDKQTLPAPPPPPDARKTPAPRRKPSHLPIQCHSDEIVVKIKPMSRNLVLHLGATAGKTSRRMKGGFCIPNQTKTMLITLKGHDPCTFKVSGEAEIHMKLTRKEPDREMAPNYCIQYTISRK